MRRKLGVAEHYFAEHPKSRVRCGLIRACLRGRFFEFLTASGVFSRSRVDLGTRLLVECMVLPESGCVLDLGCGYGVVGVVAAALNPGLRVLLVDVNSRALWLARRNVEANGLSNAEVRRSDLYDGVEGFVFDCVLTNPPVTAGMDVVRAMVVGAPEHLVRGGVFEMVVRSKVAGRRLCSFFEEAFGGVEVLGRGSGYRVLMSRKS